MLSTLPPVNNPEIFIAVPVPTRAFINAQTAAYCSVLNQHPSVKWGFVNGMSPEFSRNSLIEHHFHNDPCWTHIYFIDSDIVPPPDALVKLLEMRADVAVGICPILSNGKPVWNVRDPDEDRWIRMNEQLPDDVFETKSCGAGCLLVRREVLVDIKWPWFKTEYQQIYENKGQGIKTGEDVYFARKVQECGYKLYANPNVRCKHFNTVDLLDFYNACV